MTLNPGDQVHRKGNEHLRWVIAGADKFKPNWVHLVRDNPDGLRIGVSCSEGDLTLVEAAPTYSPGDTLHYRHRKCEVVRELGEGKVRVKFLKYYPTHQPSGVQLNFGNVEGDVLISDIVAQTHRRN